MEEKYMYFLAKTMFVGKKTYERIIDCFGAPSEFYKAPREQIEASGILNKNQADRLEKLKSTTDIDAEIYELRKKGIRFLSIDDMEYPKRLREISDAPPFLFLKGKLPAEILPSVSVIGARECTVYGGNIAARLGELLAQAGIPLISGMARGVDSVSQNAAVLSGGSSLAVLGGGVDICYPRESMRLYERLIETGGIISEYPPGTKPMPQYFALRNRLISGLSDAVCVVEAKEKSGTLITVDCALEQGKEVFAVPGRITDITSFGTNEMIRQGAGIISDLDGFVRDFVAYYGGARASLGPAVPAGLEPSVFCGLSANEKLVLCNTDENSFTPDIISERTGLPAYEILGICVLLSAGGLLKSIGAGRFVPTREGIALRNKMLEKGCEKATDV